MPKQKRAIETEIRAVMWQAFNLGETSYWVKKKFYTDILTGIVKEENLELFYLMYCVLLNNAKRYYNDYGNFKSRPYWHYSADREICECSICKKLNNKVFLYNNHIWDEFYPPNHLGCTAMIYPLTEKEMQSKNLSVTEYINLIHQEIKWAFNPAKADIILFIENMISTIIKRKIF